MKSDSWVGMLSDQAENGTEGGVFEEGAGEGLEEERVEEFGGGQAFVETGVESFFDKVTGG